MEVAVRELRFNFVYISVVTDTDKEIELSFDQNPHWHLGLLRGKVVEHRIALMLSRARVVNVVHLTTTTTRGFD